MKIETAAIPRVANGTMMPIEAARQENAERRVIDEVVGQDQAAQGHYRVRRRKFLSLNQVEVQGPGGRQVVAGEPKPELVIQRA